MWADMNFLELGDPTLSLRRNSEEASGQGCRRLQVAQTNLRRTFLRFRQATPRILERLKESGLPQTIKVDNSSEFISKALDALAQHHGVKLEFSRPGKPTANAFIESFNDRYDRSA
jgi:transposase InsO family protein